MPNTAHFMGGIYPGLLRERPLTARHILMQKVTASRASSTVACGGAAQPHQYHLRSYQCQRFHIWCVFFGITHAVTDFVAGHRLPGTALSGPLLL